MRARAGGGLSPAHAHPGSVLEVAYAGPARMSTWSICGSRVGGATNAAVAANRRTSPLAEVVARASRVGVVESQAR